MSRHPAAPARLRLAPHLVLAAFSVGLVAALGPAVPAGAVAAAAVGAATGAVVAVARGRAGGALCLLVAAALLAGLAWGTVRVALTQPPRLDLPVRVVGTIVIDTPPVLDARGGRRARAVVEAVRTEGTRVPAGTRVLLELPADDPPPVGTRLRVTGRLRPPAASASPDWWRRWLARQGIAGRLRPDSAEPDGRRGGPAGLRDRWRAWAGGSAGAGLSGDRRALVRGLALGGGSELSQEAQDAFRDAGVWHLLAVSGQNVTVVAIATLALLTALGLRRRPAVAGAALVMTAYCLACDGGASVGRAGLVGALGLAAELRSAARERWHLLLAGLAILLAHQPRAIADPGLQLSFAAVAGLFTLTPALAGWLRGWMPGAIADLAAMAAAASLATAPVVVAHFGRLSLAGLVVNVVAVPLAAPIVILALAGLAVGAVLPAAGVAVSVFAGVGASVLLLLARLGSSVPGAAVDLPAAAAIPLGLLVVAIVIVTRLLRPGGGGLRALRRTWRPWALVLATVLAAAWALTRPPPPPPWPPAAALTALDVGQGDAILLRSPEGAAVLVDAGPPGDPAPATVRLRRLGVGRLDALVLTHDSLDHAGGAEDLLRHLDVGTLLTPRVPADGWTAPAARALEEARRRGVPVREVATGDLIAAGVWRLRVLSPAGARPAAADPNPYSLVAHARAGDLDALLTGDAESDALAGLPLQRVEVLKVSHHGSEDPGLASVLTRLRPRVAVVSSGEGNPFGHPRAPTLHALATAGAHTWRTDIAGDVTVTGGDGELTVVGSR